MFFARQPPWRTQHSEREPAHKYQRPEVRRLLAERDRRDRALRDFIADLVERGFRDERARSRNPGGRGLGLDITKRVLDAHGMSLRMSVPEAGGLQVEIEGACS